MSEQKICGRTRDQIRNILLSQLRMETEAYRLVPSLLEAAFRTPARENEALRQIIREALPLLRDYAYDTYTPSDEEAALLERMRAAIGD